MPVPVVDGLFFVEDARLLGAKDIWSALQQVLEDPTIDTAYLLSSGEPDEGLYVHSNRLIPALRDLNRFHKVVVHVVAYSDVKFYRDQMQAIAEATQGEFRYYE